MMRIPSCGGLTVSALLAFALSAPMQTVRAQQRIWVDTDISSGKLKGDMDDAIALVMLLRDTTIHIEGISLVHGVKHAERITRRLLAWYAPDRFIPLHVGADSHRGFGEENAAVRAMAEALREGPMSILALGPVTNVATLLKQRPELKGNVREVAFCAGRRPGQVFTPKGGTVRFTDYNFELDTVAARHLLQSGVPLILAGYDCADSLFISRPDYRHLQRSDHSGDRWMYRKMARWEWIWRSFFGVRDGFIPFDVATVAALLYRDEVETERLPASVRTGENDTPRSVRSHEKSYLLVEEGAGTVEVDYCHHSTEQLRERLLRALRRE